MENNEDYLEYLSSQLAKEQDHNNAMMKDALNGSSHFYYNSAENVDFGIPTDETSKLYNPDNYNPDLRDKDSQVDFGIPTQDVASMQQKSIERWEKEKNEKYKQLRDDIIKFTPTKYETKTETKEKDFNNHLVNVDANWALNKLRDLLIMPDTVEYTKYVVDYLENLKANPEYYNKILFTILNDFVGIKKKVIKGEYLQRAEKQELFNSIKFFAILVEKKYPINYDLFNAIEVPYKREYGEFFSTERIPYDLVIQQMIDVIEKKSDVIGNEVTNPINVITSTNGNEKMKVTVLGKLALKAHYTNHKLSEDVLNFPNDLILTNNSLQDFQNARSKQQQQDQIVRRQQLASLVQEKVETKEGYSL